MHCLHLAKGTKEQLHQRFDWWSRGKSHTTINWGGGGWGYPLHCSDTTTTQMGSKATQPVFGLRPFNNFAGRQEMAMDLPWGCLQSFWFSTSNKSSCRCSISSSSSYNRCSFQLSPCQLIADQASQFQQFLAWQHHSNPETMCKSLYVLMFATESCVDDIGYVCLGLWIKVVKCESVFSSFVNWDISVCHIPNVQRNRWQRCAYCDKIEQMSDESKWERS